MNVNVVPMFIFLLRDGKSQYTLIISLLLNIMLLTGTVVSLQSSIDSNLTNPISQRLRSRDTVLTKTADPSLLVHALLDLSMRLTLIEIGQSLIVIIQLWTRPSKSLINTSLKLPI